MLHLRVFIIIFSSSEKSTDKDLVNSILDVEDLVKFGNKQRWDLYIHVHLLVYLTDQSLFLFIRDSWCVADGLANHCLSDNKCQKILNVSQSITGLLKFESKKNLRDIQLTTK